MTTTSSLRLGHAAVITPDLDRFRAFYENTIGLRLVATDESPPPPADRLGVFATDTAVALLAFEIPGSDPRPGTQLGERGAVDHFAFQVDTRTELDAVAQRLAAAGASDGDVCTLSRGPVQSVAFTDPDGRALNVVCPNPDWRPDPGVQITDDDLLARTIHPQPRRPR